MGSMNCAKLSHRRGELVFDTVFENSFETILAFVREMGTLGIRPEHQCFDSGHVANLGPLLAMGLPFEPLQISCVLGVLGGIRPGARALAHMADQIPGGADGGANRGVIGVGRGQRALIAAALTLGGNVRAGLEDDFYLPDRTVARSNGELVARAQRLTEDVGRRVASVAEARTRLDVTSPEGRNHS